MQKKPKLESEKKHTVTEEDEKERENIKERI